VPPLGFRGDTEERPTVKRIKKLTKVGFLSPSENGMQRDASQKIVSLSVTHPFKTVDETKYSVRKTAFEKGTPDLGEVQHLEATLVKRAIIPARLVPQIVIE
jgi:hypothetical protein